MFKVDGRELKLFDELLVNELVLCFIIKNYKFPKNYYSRELKRIGIGWSKNYKGNLKAIIENSAKINFRKKHIIFLGFSNREWNSFYFFLTTTKKSSKVSQFAFYRNILSQKQVYINTDKIFYYNFSKSKFIYSSKNISKSYIDQYSLWKNEFLMSLKSKILKDLIKYTNLEIYPSIYFEKTFIIIMRQ